MEGTSQAIAGHAVFETVIGFMGIAWSEGGLTRLCLPERSRDAVERRLLRHAAGGKIGGFSAPGGSTTKEKMLAMEGVRVGPPPPAQVSFGF
ncbi:MAG: hypothetical protein E5Y58_17410 [Mesorhizobium sp.]|nr:MAG: hypothetical protein E5Y58_17410 [Mesorhizobium sp.]